MLNFLIFYIILYPNKREKKREFEAEKKVGEVELIDCPIIIIKFP